MNSNRRPLELKTDSGRLRIFSTAGPEIDKRPAINQKNLLEQKNRDDLPPFLVKDLQKVRMRTAM
jgi:hypothetical protein